MEITTDSIFTFVTLVVSALALYFAVRKQGKEGKNIDANTIDKLFKTIREQKKQYEEEIKKQKKRYNDLREKLDDYKRVTNEQLTALANETARVRAWAYKLVKQLKDAGIVPQKFE